MIGCVIVFLMSILKNTINEKWARERDNVACIPADTEITYPGVYLQSAAHPVNVEARVQSFIEEYVHLTRDDQIVDYHKLATDKRYDKARLSDTKWKSIFMSKEIERDLNMLRYIESYDRYQELNRDRKSIIFLIDEILTFPVPLTNSTVVIVRGQYEGIYDQGDNKGKTLPPDFLGYREIRYIVQQSFPRVKIDRETEKKEIIAELNKKRGKDQKVNIKNIGFENKFGLYVVWSEEKVLNAGEKLKLEERSRDHLVQQNFDHLEELVTDQYKKEAEKE